MAREPMSREVLYQSGLPLSMVIALVAIKRTVVVGWLNTNLRVIKQARLPPCSGIGGRRPILGVVRATTRLLGAQIEGRHQIRHGRCEAQKRECASQLATRTS
jgi:hypothetical protein